VPHSAQQALIWFIPPDNDQQGAAAPKLPFRFTF